MPPLCRDRDHRAVAPHRARLPHLPLRPVPPDLQRAYGLPYNHLQYPTDLVLLVVLWRLRDRLSRRDLAGMVLARGCVFSHEAVRD